MRVLISTGTRLHLGFHNILDGRIAYGSIGLSLWSPTYILSAEKTESKSIIIKGAPQDLEKKFISAMSSLDFKGFKLEVIKFIPRHIGLSSTTQFLLGGAYAVYKLHKKRFKVRDIAATFSRGFISGIGIASFERGGFIIDSGRFIVDDKLRDVRGIDDIPKVLVRIKIPYNWRFILATPLGIKGYDEIKEKAILEKPKMPPKEVSLELSRLTFRYMIWGVLRGDVELFGKALTKVQMLIGKHFSHVQGGTFSNPLSEEVFKHMIRLGGAGGGQSSWGPTVYTLVDSPQKAITLFRKLSKFLRERGIKCRIWISRPKNRGPLVKILN